MARKKRINVDTSQGKPASRGLWGALERFFGRPGSDNRKYDNEDLPSTKRKRQTQQKKKDDRKRKEDNAKRKQVISIVLEDSRLNNARAMTEALEGRKQSQSRSPDPMAPVDVPKNEPAPTPEAPKTPRPRGDDGRFLPTPAEPDRPAPLEPAPQQPQPQPQPGGGSRQPSRDPWGGRGYHIQPKAPAAPPEWKLPPGPYVTTPQGVDSILPPRADTGPNPFDINTNTPRKAKEATDWIGKLVESFRTLHRSMDGTGGGGGRGGGGFSGMQRMMQLFTRFGARGLAMSGGGGAGAGGGPMLGMAAAGGARGLGSLAAVGGAVGTVGAFAGGVLAAVGALALLHRVSTKFAEAQAESLRVFSGFNAKIAGAFIRQDFAAAKRNFAQGAMNAESSERLITAVSKMKDETLPIKAAVTELLNVTATAVVGILRDINGALMNLPILSGYLKSLKEKAEKESNAQRSSLAKWFGDVGQGVFNRKPGENN